MPITVTSVSTTLEYSHAGVVMEAYIAKPTASGRSPTVLVCHAWAGRDKFVQDIANKLASLGYVGVALDVYGKGKLGTNKEENMALMQPLLDDRSLLQARLVAGIAAVEQQPYVNNTKMVVIGYCFGGLCALDLARMNMNIKGALSVHGLLNPPNNLHNQKTATKILALHGHLDPMVTPTDVNQFMDEMDSRSADWQMVTYGKAKHAFTNPQANDHVLGTVYDLPTANRSWLATLQFLAECTAK